MKTVVVAGKICQEIVRTVMDNAISGLVSEESVRLIMLSDEEEREEAEKLIRTYRSARKLWREDRQSGPFRTDVDLCWLPLPDLTERRHEPAREKADRIAEHFGQVLWSKDVDHSSMVWYEYLAEPETAAVFESESGILIIADPDDEEVLPGIGMMVRINAVHTDVRVLLLSPDLSDPEERIKQLRTGLERLCSLNALPGKTPGTAGTAEAVLLAHMPTSCQGGRRLTVRLAVAAALERMNEEAEAFGRPLTIADSAERMLSDVRTVPERRAGALAVFMKSAVLPVIRKRLQDRNPVHELKPRWWFHGLRKSLRDGDVPSLKAQTEDLESCFDTWLRRTAELIRETDATLRKHDETEWISAVQAYGRLVTDCSELRIEELEAEAAELEHAAPVHRHSMADTEEEQQLARLKELRARVSEEELEFMKFLPVLGGTRFLSVLHDCEEKCGIALQKTEDRLQCLKAGADPAEDSPEQRIETKRMTRRVRSLQAALERVKNDRRDWIRKGWWKTSARSSTPVAPLQNALLNREMLDLMLDRGMADVPLKRFPGKDLSPAAGCLSVAAMAEQLDLHSPTTMEELLEVCAEICTPKTEMTEKTDTGRGELLLYPENSLWALRAENPIPSELAEYLPVEDIKKDSGTLRGTLALLLLWNDWKTDDGAELAAERCDGTSSENIQLALKSRQREAAYPVILKRDGIEKPLAVIFPGGEILCAEPDPGVAGLLPERVIWIDRETGAFRDPCAMLNESDAVLLTRKLTVMRTARLDPSFSAFLQRFAVDISKGRNSLKQSAGAELDLRSAAVDTLLERSTSRGLMRVRREEYRTPSVYMDPIITALTGKQISLQKVTVPDRTVYLWRGFPFARTSGTNRLEPVLPLWEQATLDELAGELQSMQQETLEWPWQKDSPSFITKVSEAFPDLNEETLATPFSEVFALCDLPADMEPGLLDNSGLLPLLSSEGGRCPKAAFYPFSEEMTMRIQDDPILKKAIGKDSVGVVAQQDGSMRVLLVLHGLKDMTMTRVYTPAEQIRFGEDELPGLEVWPFERYPEEVWHLYRLLIRNNERFSFGLPVPGDGSLAFYDGKEEAALAVNRLPDCIPSRFEDRKIGCLLNRNTKPILPKKHAILCVDPGEAGTAVLMDLDGNIRYPRLNERKRALLPDGGHPARQDQDGIGAVIPSIVELGRKAGEGRLAGLEVLRDHTDADPRLLYSHMKWRPGEEAREAEKIWLRETMLRVLLDARDCGAADIGWRFTLPEGMTEQRTDEYRKLITALAEQLSKETGVPFTEGTEHVLFFKESDVLKRYFSRIMPEAVKMGCMFLDIGHSGANFTVWLRGGEAPAVATRVPLGTQFMFMRPALEHPELLERDFASLDDPTLRRKLELVLKRAEEVRNEPWRLYSFSLALDRFLTADSALIQWMDARAMSGCSTLLHSLILLDSCFLMALCASVTDQIAEDPAINDLLPKQMTLCLAGRGNLLPELLAPAARERIRSFTGMNLSDSNHVPEVLPLMTRDPKQEMNLGMCRSPVSERQTNHAVQQRPGKAAVSPMEWIGVFLNEFRDAFPDACDYLFPGLFTGELPDADLLMENLVCEAFGEPGVSFQMAMCTILDRLLQVCGT